MSLTSANINVMVKASRKAAKILIRDFGEIEKLQVSLKGPGDFVTASDKKVEKIIINELGIEKSGYSVLTEERGVIEGKNKTSTENNSNLPRSIPKDKINLEKLGKSL